MLVLMTPRYHCLDEMDYLGMKDGLHWFECKFCAERECTKNPNEVILEESPRYSMTEHRLGSIISNKYNK